jgi:L-lactate dehydrogenase
MNEVTQVSSASAGIRYNARRLEEFAEGVLRAAGLSPALAASVAHILVEGDLLGHDTHGLALLAPYVKEIQAGRMATDGSPQTLSDRGASMLWDGGRLPGPWLVTQGIDALIPRAREYGCATLVIKRSHHIACLASYLLQAIEADMLIVLSCSDPAGRSVAPFGGTRAVFTPNPLAVGIPATSPVLVDISASLTTNGMSTRVAQQGKAFDEAWFMDAGGTPTNDPKVLFDPEPGTILPLGGMAAGHKGYGLALLIEALTGGLAGHGRADHEQGWGATVFISLYDTLAFGGKAAFRRQMDWIAAACRDNLPRPGVSAVRMPGDRGLAQRADQLHHGVRLHDGIVPALAQCAAQFGLSLPSQQGQ